MKFDIDMMNDKDYEKTINAYNMANGVTYKCKTGDALRVCREANKAMKERNEAKGLLYINPNHRVNKWLNGE